MVASNRDKVEEFIKDTRLKSIDTLMDKGEELRRRYYEQRMTEDDGSLEEWMRVAILEHKEDMEVKEEASRRKAGFEQWGDTFIGEKKDKGSLRLVSQNQDKFGSMAARWRLDGNEELGDELGDGRDGKSNEELWTSWSVRQADVLLLQDTAWEDPHDVNQPALHTAGKAAIEMKKLWGGKHARLVTSQGYKARKHGWKGGTAVGTHSALKPFAGTKSGDRRGLGRYAITHLVGANGCTVMIVSWYIPTRSVKGAWKYQLEWMDKERARLQKLRELTLPAVGATESYKTVVGNRGQVRQTVGERGQLLSSWEMMTLGVLEQEGVDPKVLLLADIEYEIGQAETEYVIIGGDANTTPPDLEMARSCVKVKAHHVRDTEGMAQFCERQQLVEPYRALGHDEVPQTWRGRGKLSGNWSWIDYWLVSKRMIDRGLVRKCGVVRDFAESTDHAALYMDLDWENLIGRSELWEDIAALQGKKKAVKQQAFGVVKLKDNERVRCMHEMLLSKDDGQVHEEADYLLELAESGKFGEEHWERAEVCMNWVEQTLVDAQTEVFKAVVPEAGGGKAGRKHHFSREFVRIKERHRALVKMTNRWRSRKRSYRCLWKLAVRATKVFAGELPRCTVEQEIPDENTCYKDWEQWIGVLFKLQNKLRAEIHGVKRRNMRAKHVIRHDKLKDWVDDGQIGKAFDNVRKRQRDGAVDTAIITGTDGRRRAAKNAGEVIQHHYDVAVKWMGNEHKRWYYDAEGCVCESQSGDQDDGSAVIREDVHDCGKDRQVLWRADEVGVNARMRLAEGTYLEDDELRQALPAAFHDLVTDLQRAEIETSDGTRPIAETDYEGSGLGEVIGYEDWRQFWRRVKGGTRGGATGLHVDLIKVCYSTTKDDDGKVEESLVGHFADTAWKLLNVAIVMRRDYRSWLQEQLFYFIKNPGTVGLENSRPVGLLEILFKCREAFDSAALMQVWRRTGVLQPEQWAYQEGKGCEGPLLMWMLLSEESYRNKEDMGEGETDSERAFDAPSPEAIAISQKRLAVPQWKVDADMRRKQQTRTRVITPFGLTAEFHRVQGIAQGGAGSPAEWLMLIDSLAAYVKRVANDQPGALVTERGDRLEVTLNLLADDQGYAASGRGVAEALEQRIRAATTWCSFFGVNTKLVKSWVALGIWGDSKAAEGKRLLHEWEHGQSVRLVDEFRGSSTALKTKGPYAVSRILGQQRSLAQYADASVEHAKAELRVTAAAVRQMPAHKGLATRVAQAVGWRRVAYRLRFVYVFEQQMDAVVMPLKTALVSKLGLAPGTPLGVWNSAIMMSAADAMLVERVALFVKLLNTEDMRGWALRGAVQRQQQYEGCREPVLQAGNARCRCVELLAADQCCKGMRGGCSTMMHWSGTWVGMLARGLVDAGMEIEGGLGMPLLRVGDRCLVDEADSEEREMVRAGCLATEMWRYSEVMDLEGCDICRALCSNGPAEKAAGKRWCDWVRSRVTGVVGNRGLRKGDGGWVHQGELGAWYNEAVWSWQLVSWVDEEGSVVVGKPVGQEGDKIKVHVLENMTMEAYCECQDSVAEGAGWAGTTLTKAWHNRCGAVDGQCWLWDGSSARPKGVVWKLIGELHPVSAERWEAKEHWGVKVLYRLSELCEGLAQGGSGAQLVRHGRVRLDESASWGRRKVEEMVDAPYGVLTDWSKLEQLRGRSEGMGDKLVLFTDGGLDNGGTGSAAGQYAAVIARLEDLKLEVLAKQGGVCQGPREWMSSHRSELMAVVLGVAMLRVWAEWEGLVEVWLDNEAVVRGCQQLVGAEAADEMFHSGRNLRQGKVCGYSNRETWMWSRDDRDLWEVLEGLLKWTGVMQLSFHWVKSHQDEVKGVDELLWFEKGNVLVDAECNKMKGVMAGVVVQKLPRARSWRLVAAGREVVAPLRKAMEEELRSQRLLKYLRDERGWGDSADRWMDGITRKMWMLGGVDVSQRVTLIKYVFAMIGTDDVVAENWVKKQGGDALEVRKTQEYGQMMQCSLCLQEIVPRGRYSRNWHLVSECKCEEVVKLRRRLQAEVSLAFEHSEALNSKLDWLCAPWMLHKDGTVVDLGAAEELALVLDTEDPEVRSMLAKLKATVGIGTVGWEEKRKLLYKGQMGAEWQHFLEHCGAEPVDAAVIRKKVFRCAMKYGEDLQSLYWELKNRPVEESSSVDVAAREAAQSLIAAELGGIGQEQLGLVKKRLAGMGLKRKVEWAVKRKSRRRREQEKDKEVVLHITRAEMRSNMSKWMRGSRKDVQVLAHELHVRNNLETVAGDGVGNRGHGLDRGAGARELVCGDGSEAEGEAERAGGAIGCDRSGGSTGANDGAGGGRAQRKRGRWCISSDEEEATEECGQRCQRLVVVDGGCAAARGCGERKRAATEQGSNLDTVTAAELACGAGSGLEVMGRDEVEGSGDSGKDSRECGARGSAAAEDGGSQAVWATSEEAGAELRGQRGAALGNVSGVRGAGGGAKGTAGQLRVVNSSGGAKGSGSRIGARRGTAGKDCSGSQGMAYSERSAGRKQDSTLLVRWLGSKGEEGSSRVGVAAGGGGSEAARAEAQSGCAAGSAADCSAVLGAGVCKEVRQGSSGYGGALGCYALHHSSKERCEQQGAEGCDYWGDGGSVQQLQAYEGQVQATAALSRDKERRRLQGCGQASVGCAVGNAGQWDVRGIGAAGWTAAEDTTIETEGALAGAGRLLSTVERLGEEAGDEVAENDLPVGDASRWAEDAAGGEFEVWGEMQVQEGQQQQTCGAGRGDDRGDANNRDGEGAIEVCVPSRAVAEDTEVPDGGVGNRGGGMLVMGADGCYCWCGERMRLTRMNSLGGAGTCNVEGYGGRAVMDELVYACTEHDEYACRECVPRASRLTVDALLDECARVEWELEQFSQDLGLSASGARRERDGVADGRKMVGVTAGVAREEGLEEAARSGIVAASWVAGRRRAARRGTGSEVSERSGTVGGVMGGLNTERVSARGDLAPQSPNLVEDVVQQGGDDLASQSPNLVREVVRGGPANHVDEEAAMMGADGSREIPVDSGRSSLPLASVVQEQEQRWGQEVGISTGGRTQDEGHFSVNLGQKSQELAVMMTKKKAGENTMMERLEGDEGIE